MNQIKTDNAKAFIVVAVTKDNQIISGMDGNAFALINLSETVRINIKKALENEQVPYEKLVKLADNHIEKMDGLVRVEKENK